MSSSQGKFACLILIKAGKHLDPTKYKSFVATVHNSERVNFFKVKYVIIIIIIIIIRDNGGIEEIA